jgi:ferredoxin
MAELVVENAEQTIDAPEGGSVLELCEEAPGHGLAFSCQEGRCGTCQVEVLEGSELCEEARPEEREMLDILCAGPGDRLACQLRLRAAPGRIVLKPA